VNTRKQLLVLGTLLLADALLAFVYYITTPLETLSAGQPVSPVVAAVPRWQLGLANAAIIVVLYGILGLVGLWFARRLGLPGVWRENARWRDWLWRPLPIGVALGVVFVVLDRVFASAGQWPGFEHPPFPASLFASATAGIGEEIIFRMFVLGLWAFLFNLVLRRWSATGVALWIGNVLAALAFGASHLPSQMILLNVKSPAQLPPLMLGELFLLNGIMGIAAGIYYRRDGLVAASGIHFWADVVWHVIFPLIAL
jgi:hypothetical protein